MKLPAQSLWIALAISLVIGVIFVALGHTQTTPVSANLTWTANTESDMAGYRLYRGQGTTQCTGTASLPQLTTATIGLVTAFTDATVPRTDGPLCYELTAVDTAGNVSARSVRVTKVLNVNPPLAPQNLNFVIP